MRVAIYYRVSTKMQEDRYSLSAQKSELRAYAKKQEWKIIREYKDVDTGGKLDKQGLTSLLDTVEEGLIDVVLCIDQDRLSRLDTVAWEYLKDTLRENHVKIAEPGNITDLTNEDDEFISDIKNLIARREKKAIVRRMMRGKRQRLREGKGWGKPPFEYVYNKEKEEYEVREGWEWVIPFIDDRYLNKQEGSQLIAKRLNDICRTPLGSVWTDTIVRRRLLTKAYHGIMEKSFSNGEVIEIELYPKMRSKETYDQIQKERKKRSEVFRVGERNVEHKSIFSQIYIECGNCGRKISIINNGMKKSGPRYYFKHSKDKKWRDGSVCGISVNTIRYEGNLQKAFKRILTSENESQKYIDMERQDTSELKKEIESLSNRLIASQTKLDKLIDLYLDGEFGKEMLARKQESIQTEIDELTGMKKRLERKLSAIQEEQWNYELLVDYLESIEDMEKELTSMERAKLVADLFPYAILYDDHLLLKADIYPIDIKIPIDPDPFPNMHGGK